MRRMLLIGVGILGLAGWVFAFQQTYPNVSVEKVLENDRVLVERVKGQPGQWAGEHSRPGNQFVVLLKGGTTTIREGGKEREESSKDGDVFWLDAVTHDHAGKSATEALLITISSFSTSLNNGDPCQLGKLPRPDARFSHQKGHGSIRTTA